MIKRALISVSNKTGIVEFAKKLHEAGVEIISTGGTKKALAAANIPVTYVSDVTGFPEIMDGRVKTLNPFIHGGILALRDNQAHQQQMKEHNIQPIDLVVVNLYPFKQTISKTDVTLAEAIENIDIGGPAMIRAAAKNFSFVTVVVNPAKYDVILKEIQDNGEVSAATRMELACEAFAHTAEYDACITDYLARRNEENLFPANLHLVYEKIQDLRYGENPHQQAAFYRIKDTIEGVAGARQLHGKELSFNNIVDTEAAYAIVADFEVPAAAVIKHTNPCGTGTGKTISEAYCKAYECDPVSAFGGIIALNREVDAATADEINKIFVEVIIAPSFTQQAVDILSQRKNVRLLEAPLLEKSAHCVDIKRVSGGIVVQNCDTELFPEKAMKVVTKRTPTDDEYQQLLFAWRVVKHVKSNAIVLAKNNQTVGVGAGQMNRVGAAEIAIRQAGEKTVNSVMASDAFFPFRDTIDAAAKAGVTAIIQPGGSVRDAESIQAADEHGIAMIFTGMRHFKH